MELTTEYIQDPEVVREKISGLIKEKGLEMKELSLQVGRNHSYIQQYITRKSPNELPEKIRFKLAQLLDIPEQELRTSVSDGNFGQALSVDFDSTLHFQAVTKTLEAFEFRKGMFNAKSIAITDQEREAIALKVYQSALEIKRSQGSCEINVNTPLALIDSIYFS